MPIAWRGVVLSVSVLGFSQSYAAGPLPPVSAFASSSQVLYPALSPGGTMLAWLDASSDQPRINVYDIGAKKATRALAVDPTYQIRGITWGDDATLLYGLSQVQKWPSGSGRALQTKMEISRIFAITADDKVGRMMMAGDTDAQLVNRINFLRARTTKPNTIVVSLLNFSSTAARAQTGSNIDRGHQASGEVLVAYEVDTHTGKGERVALGDAFTHQWLVNADGQVVGRSEMNVDAKTCAIEVKHGLAWDGIFRRPCDEALQIEGLTADQNSILMIDKESDGRAKLWALPLDGSKRSVVLEDPTGSVMRVAYDWVKSTPTEAWITGGAVQHIWLDKDSERRFKLLQGSFPNRLINVEAESKDQNVVVIRVSGPSNVPIHYLIDLTTHHADILGVDAPGLANVKLGPVTTLHYKAHDGSDIEGYLTLPPDAGDGALPLVVLPHGLARRDVPDDYETMRQFLASRGYAVFQPQFRGSWGFGDAFQNAGDHQWGLLMQDDLTDGVKALIDKGRVDAQRICIVGYSYSLGYGGYAALAGAAFTPGLYKCAISVNGVSDLPKFLGYLVDKWGNESGPVVYAHERIGAWGDPNVIARSPARAADAVTAAVLLIDSADDADVPPSQSKLMADALRAAGKNVQVVELAGTDHTMRGAEARAFEEIDKFLHDHL